MIRSVLRLLAALAVLGALLLLLLQTSATGFSLGELLDPVNGLYRTAAFADRRTGSPVSIDGLSAAVRIVRDRRGVPHIFAESDRDAVMALGYATAQDRLFQIDFVARTAMGQISEVLGRDALPTDTFFRHVGMRLAVERNAEWMRSRHRPETELISWYQAGVNAWIDQLAPEDEPFEFRLLGYHPSRLRLEDALSVIIYMTYDLTYTDRDFQYSVLRERLSQPDYENLYPSFSNLSVPIVREEDMVGTPVRHRLPDAIGKRAEASPNDSLLHRTSSLRRPPPESVAEGFLPGKGSNNWAVAGTRSTTGYPILAGDIHLNLSVPSIWYEAQLVTPTMNVYGVTIPGAPSIVEGITPETAWAFTNTGSDQIDYYALKLAPDRAGYMVDGDVVPFELRVDTIAVSRSEAVVDTVTVSRFGPVIFDGSRATAIRWVAHDTLRTVQAIWEMAHARDYEEFQRATRSWDAPMQNILFASRDGTIAIRSTGYLPLRGGENGSEVLDGSTSGNDWIGRVPFEELPASISPGRGTLTSTNQQPAGSWYPYYLGSDWRDAYRSIRIDELLASRATHSVSDIESYQADVHAVQADLFLPILEDLHGLGGDAEDIRRRLLDWDRETTVEKTEPFLLDRFLSHLADLVWDEEVFQGTRTPSETRLADLLREDPESPWFDRVETSERETARDILAAALEAAASDVADVLHSDPPVRWGERHEVLIRHLTRAAALRPLWRGPYPYPGYRDTLSPGGSMTTTHSASWRMVVDFSSQPPNAYGVYPGGQSGNPFSVLYDDQIDTYLKFGYNELLLPGSLTDFPVAERMHETVLTPADEDR